MCACAAATPAAPAPEPSLPQRERKIARVASRAAYSIPPLPICSAHAISVSALTTATTRSLRELRAWTDELASAGIRILGSDGSVGAPAGGANIGGGSEGAAAPHRQDRRDEMGLLADLEGGSGGGAAGAVPFLMVGAKEDIGEGVRRDGARLASELGMGHVVVVSPKLC